jgi:thiamine-monophosphate kinase
MKISEMGEFGLIDLLAKTIADTSGKTTNLPPLTINIGDDAAAWPLKSGTQLATIDSLIENVHFTLSTITWEELGWKSLAVNLSDIAAMGGIPEYALVSLGLPEDTDSEDVTALYRGMAELAGRYRVAIAGGDTCRSPAVMITVTILGTDTGEPLRRSSAQTGEKIAVTGHLGGAAAGMDMLKNSLNPGTEISASLRSAFNKPVPRVTEGQLLARNGIRTAIDISDGFLADLGHITAMSGVSARVNIDSLPVYPPAVHVYGEKALEIALSGGEDYELLFTGPAEKIEKIKKECSCPVTVVGEITEGKSGDIELIDTSGNPVNLTKSGWEHFRSN